MDDGKLTDSTKGKQNLVLTFTGYTKNSIHIQSVYCTYSMYIQYSILLPHSVLLLL